MNEKRTWKYWLRNYKTIVIFCKRGYQVQQINLIESANYFPNARFDQMYDSISNHEAYINNETIVVYDDREWLLRRKKLSLLSSSLTRMTKRENL